MSLIELHTTRAHECTRQSLDALAGYVDTRGPEPARYAVSALEGILRGQLDATLVATHGDAFVLAVELNNEAMTEPGALADVLRRIASKVDDLAPAELATRGTARDLQGATTAEWTVVRDHVARD